MRTKSLYLTMFLIVSCIINDCKSSSDKFLDLTEKYSLAKEIKSDQTLPRNVKVTAGKSEVTVEWEKPVEPVDVIVIKSTNDEFQPVELDSSATSSYTISNLFCGTAYEIEVFSLRNIFNHYTKSPGVRRRVETQPDLLTPLKINAGVIFGVVFGCVIGVVFVLGAIVVLHRQKFLKPDVPPRKYVYEATVVEENPYEFIDDDVYESYGYIKPNHASVVRKTDQACYDDVKCAEPVNEPNDYIMPDCHCDFSDGTSYDDIMQSSPFDVNEYDGYLIPNKKSSSSTSCEKVENVCDNKRVKDLKSSHDQTNVCELEPSMHSENEAIGSTDDRVENKSQTSETKHDICASAEMKTDEEGLEL